MAVPQIKQLIVEVISNYSHNSGPVLVARRWQIVIKCQRELHQFKRTICSRVEARRDCGKHRQLPELLRRKT
jgi:hypothetical protein